MPARLSVQSVVTYLQATVATVALIPLHHRHRLRGLPCLPKYGSAVNQVSVEINKPTKPALNKPLAKPFHHLVIVSHGAVLLRRRGEQSNIDRVVFTTYLMAMLVVA
jgi:hypothetical protein